MAIFIWRDQFVFDHGKIQLTADPLAEMVAIDLLSTDWAVIFKRWVLAAGLIQKRTRPIAWHYEPEPRPTKGIVRLHFGPDEFAGENGVSWKILDDFSSLLRDMKEPRDPKWRGWTVPFAVRVTVGFQQFSAGSRWRYGEKGIRLKLG